MARSKNKNPRPATNKLSGSAASGSAALSLSPMAMAAAMASALSAEMSAAPTAAPTAAPAAAPTAAPTTAPTAAPSKMPSEMPSKMPAAGPPSVGPPERAAKDEMRVNSGNLTSIARGKNTARAPSAAAGPSQPGSSRSLRSHPSVGMVVPPVCFRRATSAEKGKGPKLVKTAPVQLMAAAAPPAPRRLAVVPPRLGGNPFATLEFRKSRMPGGTGCAGFSAGMRAGSGRSRPYPPDLTASAMGGVLAVGDDVPTPSPLYNDIVTKAAATVADPSSLVFRAQSFQSDDEGGPAAPPPSPATAITAVVEPTDLLMEKIHANRKRTFTRSASPTAEKGGPAAPPTAGATQGSQTESAAAAGDGAPKSPAAAAACAEALGKDINTTLDTLLTHISEVETRLDEMCESSILLDEKMDAAVNLIQQTLMHVAVMGEKLSKELKDGFYKVRFIVSGNGAAAADDAPEKTIDLIRKFLRDNLEEDWAYTDVTADVYPSTNAYWDKAVKATSAAIKSGPDGAEVFLRSMVHLPSRKDPSVYVRMRASVPVLRVKSHLHKWYGELIWAAFVAAMMPVGKELTVEIAKELYPNRRYVLATLGKKACISAAAKLCTAVGACGRIKEPAVAGDPPVLEITLGHYAFVAMKVRNMIERLAGERPSMTVGGDGHFSMWVNEVRFLDEHLPKDDAPHDGLRLVDGSSPARSLPEITELSE